MMRLLPNWFQLARRSSLSWLILLETDKLQSLYRHQSHHVLISSSADQSQNNPPPQESVQCLVPRSFCKHHSKKEKSSAKFTAKNHCLKAKKWGGGSFSTLLTFKSLKVHCSSNGRNWFSERLLLGRVLLPSGSPSPLLESIIQATPKIVSDKTTRETDLAGFPLPTLSNTSEMKFKD